jgi:hypothetical protein
MAKNNIDSSGVLFPEDGEPEIVTLTLEDDSEMECRMIAIFPCGDKKYAALEPVEDSIALKTELLLYEYIDLDGDEYDLKDIENDDEFEEVSDAFDDFIDTVDFDDELDELTNDIDDDIDLNDYDDDLDDLR